MLKKFQLEKQKLGAKLELGFFLKVKLLSLPIVSWLQQAK